MFRVLVVALVLSVATPVRADPSERTDGQRALHFGVAAVGGSSYLVVEILLKKQISRSKCWWCEAPAFDAKFRAFKWENVERANNVSNLTGFVLSPLLALTGLAVSDDWNSRRVFDDCIPVLQAGITAGAINEVLKIVVARQRPYARFHGKDVMERPGESYTSFFSGHAALVFAMATASGTVATLRGYDSAPVLWGGGFALAAVTSYLRIASDTHYFSDVVFGAVIGSALGVAIPLLFHRDVLTDEPAATPRKQASSERPVILSWGSAF